MRDTLQQHDAALTAAISANDGYVFTTASDSFAAAFHTAESATRSMGSAITDRQDPPDSRRASAVHRPEIITTYCDEAW